MSDGTWMHFPAPCCREMPSCRQDPQQDGSLSSQKTGNIPRVETHIDREEMQAEHSTYIDLSIRVEGYVISMKFLPLNHNKNIVM